MKLSRDRTLELTSAVLVPLFILSFIVSDRLGLLDWWFGHDEVLAIAQRFETSYADNVDRQVGRDEPGWKPILRLIRRYSNVEWSREEEPFMLSRFAAVASGKIEVGRGQIAEWTSPGTPLALLFGEPTESVPIEQLRVVGTIGDLRLWVDQSRDDIRFIVQDLALGGLALLVGAMVWLRGD